MTAQERLRQAIDEQQGRLRADVPPDRPGAILALVRAQDGLPLAAGSDSSDLVTGHHPVNLGGSTALQLCLGAAGDDVTVMSASAGDGLDGWAERFLQACETLAEAELVLGHVETGFMRLADDGNGTFDAWIATKVAPTSWRERADIDWWAAWLARRHEPELRAVLSQRPGAGNRGPNEETYSRRLAGVRLEMMAYQFGYPPDAEIGGITLRTYRDVLGLLVAWALAARDRGEAAEPQSEHALIASLAATLAADPALIKQAVAAFTLDRENAAWHAAVPGVAAAPLARIAPDRLVWSLHGLLTEPFFFLTRELRRRDAQNYHNSAFLREEVFRQDLYALFSDKRFVVSSGRAQLRRAEGNVRTDLDAVVFDRKSGALGLFELKSQDPFARSTAELARQRDNVLYANRQVSGALDWLNRHGADDLLRRVDARTAKTFRVRKVFPFVLGRYIVHFSDGAEPNRRAAWGTWPQLLRLLDGEPVRASEASPLASLFTRLAKDEPLIRPPAGDASHEIAIGDSRLVVHPSFAAYRSRSLTPLPATHSAGAPPVEP